MSHCSKPALKTGWFVLYTFDSSTASSGIEGNVFKQIQPNRIKFKVIPFFNGNI